MPSPPRALNVAVPPNKVLVGRKDAEKRGCGSVLGLNLVGDSGGPSSRISLRVGELLALGRWGACETFFDRPVGPGEDAIGGLDGFGGIGSGLSTDRLVGGPVEKALPTRLPTRLRRSIMLDFRLIPTLCNAASSSASILSRKLRLCLILPRALGGEGNRRSSSATVVKTRSSILFERRESFFTISVSFSVRGSLEGSLSGFSVNFLTLLRIES